jgi:hypothetical protein
MSRLPAIGPKRELSRGEFPDTEKSVNRPARLVISKPQLKYDQILTAYIAKLGKPGIRSTEPGISAARYRELRCDPGIIREIA